MAHTSDRPDSIQLILPIINQYLDDAWGTPPFKELDLGIDFYEDLRLDFMDVASIILAVTRAVPDLTYDYTQASCIREVGDLCYLIDLATNMDTVHE